MKDRPVGPAWLLSFPHVPRIRLCFPVLAIFSFLFFHLRFSRSPSRSCPRVPFLPLVSCAPRVPRVPRMASQPFRRLSPHPKTLPSPSLRPQHKGADDDDDEDERAAAIAESGRLSTSAASGGGGAAASGAGGGVAFRRMVFITQSPLECTEVVGEMACSIRDWAASPNAPTTTTTKTSKKTTCSAIICRWNDGSPTRPSAHESSFESYRGPLSTPAIVSKRARESSIVPLAFELGLSCVVLVWSRGRVA